ncbi:type II toxin-antitoxin system prevent-host-death family antitoxin [Niveispirillum sp. BGYR6]|uniref:type II toxin-antitoxin system Phd/YefM family antitoxin n=1 Tax=Niveispirillum sp. BGYR6 TaxID=2971249 RepID=UPI0022B9A8DE|nr:type II toxin-antitoxin system prevent-host-death family antitoxin [Niveispirillum sp. BGYR6]MDG5495105.1 type II toxin-antitoxin system prevent-host-death family antitoxin [Niveispirillum sp. BGYR6]
MEELSTVEAQAQFARLIDRARKGEETVITDHGRPVARLSPVEPSEVDGFVDWEPSGGVCGVGLRLLGLPLSRMKSARLCGTRGVGEFCCRQLRCADVAAA